MKELANDHPRGACEGCAHCFLTDAIDAESGERLYACLMMSTELTYSHYALDCSQRYTEAMDE